jgi:hypothetical protein
LEIHVYSAYISHGSREWHLRQIEKEGRRRKKECTELIFFFFSPPLFFLPLIPRSLSLYGQVNTRVYVL